MSSETPDRIDWIGAFREIAAGFLAAATYLTNDESEMEALENIIKEVRDY